MSKPLPKKLRAKWDELIETEGAAMGLSDCRVFLENKMVNDIFYEGLYNGEPCIVKCSSRAPDSIRNEYEMLKRLQQIDPSVCAKPLAWRSSDDGKWAFVVVEKLSGESLSCLIGNDFNNNEFLMRNVAEDLLRIAKALHKSNIVWRDIFPDNFIMDATGHLRLIDAQFAAYRENFKEDPYLIKHWKYRISVFAYDDFMNGHGWNDMHKILFYIRNLPCFPEIEKVRYELNELAKVTYVQVALADSDRIKAFLFLIELKLRLLCSKTLAKKKQLRLRINRVRNYLKDGTLPKIEG